MKHPVHDNYYARKDSTPYAAPLANRGPEALQHLLVDDRAQADENLRALLRPELVHLAAALDELAHRCRVHLDDWGAAPRPWEPATEQPEPAPEPISAETIASALAVVDAPYRPDTPVQYLDDEPEPVREGETLGVTDEQPGGDRGQA